MSNLPIEINDKLNIWQKLKIRVFLLRKPSLVDYDYAPEYIRNSKKVKETFFKKVHLTFPADVRKCIPLFKQYSESFSEENRQKIIELSLKEYEYSILTYLSSEEQYKLITEEKSSFTWEEMLKYINIEVVERLINEKFSMGYNTWVNKFEPFFIKYCDNNVQLELISKNKDWIELSSVEVQAKYLQGHEEDIELVNSQAIYIFLEKNIEFLSNHIEYVKNASKDTQLLFASVNKENLKYINIKYQIELIEKHPSAFEYANEQVKEILFNSYKCKFKYNIEPFNVINNLIDSNIKYFKYIGYGPNKDGDIVNEYLKSLQQNIQNLESKKLIDIFVKSGILSAKGNLRTSPSSYYTGNGEGKYSFGLDIYTHNQRNTIQKLNIEQISELIKVDSNYIMPYVVEYLDGCVDKENIEEHKEKCKQVFIQLYGEEKLKEIEECIDIVFMKQIEYQENNNDTDLDRHTFKEFKKPLESLKLLFNEKIVSSNSSNLIKEYYLNLFNETEGKEEFRQIILNSYGDKAVEILNSRKKLDVYGINSLEIFDERILNNFSEEFVHDLISYNIRDFSAFLNIIKNEDEFIIFKKYYDILSEVLGKNVVTMQKAISEFYYNKELLENINNMELTEKEQINFISVLCGEKNQFDIKTIEQLDDFDEIANTSLQQKIASGIDIKKVLFENIFGISKEDAFEINDLFGLDIVSEIMDEEEIEIVKCLKTILKENNESELKELAGLLVKQTGIRNPIALHSAISKIKEHNIEFLKARMLTKERLDQICIDKQESGKIRKDNIDGIDIYYFEGLKLKEIGLGFIMHASYNSHGREFMEYEGQGGLSTVSARLFMDEQLLISVSGYCFAPDLIFSEVQEEDLVAFQGVDAGVLHAPKLVKSQSQAGNYSIGMPHKFDYGYNELAFYRRTRNHNKRKQSRKDGRIKPSYLLIFNDNDNESSIDDIPKSKLEYAKKYNIPIIVYKTQRYKEKTERENKSDEKEI
jgi:hypothetical protein